MSVIDDNLSTENYFSTDQLDTRGQSKLHFLRDCIPFLRNSCGCFISVFASVLFHEVECRGSNIPKRKSIKLDKLMITVVGMNLDPLVTVSEKRGLKKIFYLLSPMRETGTFTDIGLKLSALCGRCVCYCLLPIIIFIFKYFSALNF